MTAAEVSDTMAGTAQAERDAHYAVIAGEPQVAPRELIAGLVGRGYITLERPLDSELGGLLRSVTPGVVVLCFRRATAEVPRVIERCAERGPLVLAVIFQVQPEPDFLARCIELGTDLYYAASDRPEAVVASIAALERRLTGRRDQPADDGTELPLEVGDLTIDRARFLVLKRGEPVSLTPMEYRVLVHLAEHADAVCGAESIVQYLYGNQTNRISAGEMVKTYVKRLRLKLEDDPGRPTMLVTVRGFGYMLRAS